MKRIILLALAAAFVLSAAVNASAFEMKASGQWVVEAVWGQNFDPYGNAQNFNDEANYSHFNVFQRARTQFEFIANENLKGVLATEIGTQQWGTGAFSIGNSVAGIEVRRAYLDFNWPNTDVNVKAGYMYVGLPAAEAGGLAVMGEEVAGAVVTYPINDMFTLQGGYLRPNQAAATGTQADEEAELDAWYLAAPISLDGFQIDPWFAYAYAGQNNAANVAGMQSVAPAVLGLNDNDYTAWWGGAAFTMDYFDPFVLKADLVYGDKDSDITEAYDKKGWLFDASLAYTGWDFMTPKVFFAYTTGEDDDATDGSERLPTIVGDYAFGSFFMGGDYGLMGSMANRASYTGYWTLGLTLSDISFLEGMNHTIHALYIAGTNDADLGVGATNQTYGAYLTDEDSLFEIDFNTTYAIYDELTAYVEMGYIFSDFDEDVWGTGRDDDAAKLAMGVAYEF
jgi:hypothetical protein